MPERLGDLKDSSYSRHVSARFGDFVNPATPWPRRLWNVGTFLSLEELHEAGYWVDRRVLSQSAVDWLKHDMEELLGRETALGSKDIRRELTATLKSDLTIRSDGRRRLRDIIDRSHTGYIERWAHQVATESPPDAEWASRAVVAHLLDSGHSMTGLRRWHSMHPGLSAVDLFTAAGALVSASPTSFRMWVPVFELPAKIDLDTVRNFVPANKLNANVATVFQTNIKRAVIGSFEYNIVARDAERAAEICAEVLDSIKSRLRFSPSKASRLTTAPRVFVEDEKRFIDLKPYRRGVGLSSLLTAGELLNHQPLKNLAAKRNFVDDAFELAAPLVSGSTAPAISGSWAALEALLVDSRDSDQKEGKVVAAKNAARIVACSWPRAELTTLSYQIDPKRLGGKELVARLDQTTTNRARSEVIATHIREGGNLPLSRSWRIPSDSAAVTRMKKLVSDPSDVLERVSGYMESSFRRLYRCRNVIVHGGSTRGDVLDSSLRVSAPLVGAALDRIVHANISSGATPLMLATSADLSIQLASDSEMGNGLTELLDRW